MVDRIRLARGIVGKISYVATALLLLLIVAVLREPTYVFAVVVLGVFTFWCIWQGSCGSQTAILALRFWKGQS